MWIRTSLAASLLLLCVFWTTRAAAEMPSVRLSTAPLVTPEDALAYYNSFPNPIQHTPGATAWATPAPELTVLARGLGANQVTAGQLGANPYAERVAEYVRNNIDVEFRYGLGKGARGAIIDQSGTPFDQAHLMMELLKIANVTATYKVGTITLNAQQFGQWTGVVTNLTEATPPTLPSFTVNAVAACQFLADGGIPARVNNATSCSAVSGNLSTVTLGHIWVEVGGKLYDPAFKRYNLRAGIDLAQSMGCGTDAAPTCGALATTAATGAATVGMVVPGVRTLRGIKETTLNTQLQSLAANLQNVVVNNRPDAELEDVIGGRLPDDMYVPPPATTSLPYPAAAQLTWSGRIPDQYRTRVRFHYRVIDPLLYADELAGRRIFFFSTTPLSGVNDNPLVLIIDDFGFACSRVEPFVPVPREFETVVNHPYAAGGGAYADETRNWAFGGRQLVGNQVLIFSLGNSGAGLPRHFSEYQNALEAPPAGTFEPFSGLPIVTADAANFIAAARLLYQESLAVRMLEGVSKSRVTQHHSIGMTYDNSGPIPGTFVKPGSSGGTAFFSLETKFSVASRSNDATARTAAFNSLATVGAAIEGSVMQQALDSWIPVTTGSIFSLANSKNIPFVDVSAGSLNAVLPALLNHNNVSLQAAAAEGYAFILPQNGDPGAFSITGGLYLTVATPLVSYRSDSIAYLIGADIKGGGGQPGAESALKSVQKTLAPADRGLRRRDAISVSLATGDFTLTAPPDIVTGSGEFPYALPFQRTYVSSNSFAEQMTPFNPFVFNAYYGSDAKSFDRLGGGWTHNYQITASLGNDGDAGLGSSRGTEALAAIAGFYSVYDLARTSNFERRLTAPFVTNWVTQQFINNVATVSRQLKSSVFVRLPNGTFMPPRGSAERLTQAGTRVGPLCANECSQVSNPASPIYEPGTTYNYSSLTFSYTDADNSVISFIPSEYTKLFRIANQIALPTFTADTWTFPNGVRLKFNSSLVFDASFPITKRFLTSVSNNLGRSLTFVAKGVVPNFTTTFPFRGQPATLLTEVRDENGRAVRFERQCTPDRSFVNPGDPTFGNGPFACNTFEVITPDSTRTVYSYEITPQSPQNVTFPRPVYRLRRWFTPDDLGTPFLTIDYDVLYRVSKVLDKNLVATHYQITGLFDENQKRGELRDPLGAVTTQYFNDDNRLLATIDPLGRATYNKYDVAGRLASTTLPEGNQTAYSYDARSNLLLTTQKAKPGSGLADTVTGASYPAACTFPATCNLPTTSTDARGQVTTYTYNNATGQLLTVSSPSVPLGSGTGTPLTMLCYTSFATTNAPALSLLTGRIDRVDAAANRVTTYSYNPANKFVLSSATVDPTSSLALPAPGVGTCPTSIKSGALNLVTALAFDAAGNVASIDGPRLDAADMSVYSFDSMRRLTRTTAPLGAITRYEYLPDGLLFKTHQAQVANPVDSNPAHWLTVVRSYQPTGELSSTTDPEGNVTRFTYDASGRQVLTIDPEGRGTGTVYDPAGQVLCNWRGLGATPPTGCSWNPASYAAAGNRGAFRYAAYSYSPNGRQLSVQDANNNITGYAFDGFDRLTFTLFPDPANGTRCTVPAVISSATTPTCTSPSTQTYEKSTFDASGNRLSLRTRRGDTIAWTYDNVDRIRTKAAAALPMVTYDYNLLDETLSLTSPAVGSIPAHAVRYDYDAAGRELYEQNLLNGVEARVSYQHDAAGNRRSTLWPDGYLVSYQYDALNRMSAAWEGPVGTVKVADYDYDLLSRRTLLQYAGQPGNRTTYAYEPDSNLDVLRHALNTVNLTLDYGYNKAGQIRGIDSSDAFYLPSPSASQTTGYVPDKLNRYASVSGQASTYDNNGNLLSWFPVGGKHTYTYDSENRLRTAAVNGSSTASITYDYDALGRRLSKTVNGVATFYMLDGDEEIAELAANRAVLRRYIMGPGIDDRTAAAEGAALSNPTKTYYHVNHQGSVIAMTDSGGNATGCATGVNCQRLAYDEYGQLGAGSIGTGQPHRYTGRRFDEETGLYYYRARYYSPQLGRFLQVDPVGYADDVNLYAYVGNDPVNNRDASGEFAFLATIAIGVAIEIAVQTVEIAAGTRKDGYSGKSILVTAAASAVGFGVVKQIARIGQLGNLSRAGVEATKRVLDGAADAALSAASMKARGEEVNAIAVAQDVAGSQVVGEIGAKLATKFAKRSEANKLADKAADRLERIARNRADGGRSGRTKSGQRAAENARAAQRDIPDSAAAAADTAAGNAGSRIFEAATAPSSCEPTAGECTN